MNWLAMAARAGAELVSRFPLERLIASRPSSKERLEKLADILGEAHTEKAPTPEQESPELAAEAPRERKVALAPVAESPISTEETIDYQNREIGKLLLRMERHLAQRMRINGVPCDCGAQKHLLDLESLCEETVPMVTNPDVYYRAIEWIKVVGPKTTQEAAESGEYDGDYPGHSHEARDLRKEIMGTVDPKALFPKRLEKGRFSDILPVVPEEEKEQIPQEVNGEPSPFYR